MKNHLVGIAGSGSMGKQLALLFASCGIPVVLWNHRVNLNFPSEFKRLLTIQSRLGYINKEQINAIIEGVRYTDDISLMAECDLIIEAVKEDKSVKLEVLKKIDSISANAKVIATNTSTLSITELASFSEKPCRFLGMHFFNPPLSMKLVEVVRGEMTSEESLSFALQLLDETNKQPVVLPETPGFVVNRLLFTMINEAVFMLAEGLSDARTIDSCMRLGANHPMGPLELADLIGLDVCLSILETLEEERGDGKYRPAPLLKKHVHAGKLGKKSGLGFYSYRKRA
ncbi:3-hydroxybutyryl-CoA dehydrogenase [Mariprofundus aestuarium]|uniref:3-hydroxybutyryl-CoA dehydrogenase n=1 Tax=Mariprofundus aestuarium TaxID=1921086 RepID=A0A2K8L236_MARES|nr:3-hydroxyacyl-CoA dehydrogenase NAD-binding domain-containing protein [Mariprofundus aestuarium]ATX80289.1 3-hydroxybutyryl-CoA dehydrogenase [Mariprofundus aestuarium]